MNRFTKHYPAFRYADFRRWWVGQFMSNTGTQMQFVAVNWQMYLLTHSAFALGLVGLFRLIPIVLFSLTAGLLADTYNRKLVNLTMQCVSAGLSLFLAWVTFTHHVTPVLLYVISFCVASAVAFETPTRQALVPNLVDRKDLPNALVLVNLVKETTKTIGPAIAGFLIAAIGIGNIYLLNAVSFLVIIIALLTLKASGKVEGEIPSLSISSIKEGLHFITSKTIIWSTILLDFLSTFFSGATALLPIFAKDILQVGPQGLGLLYAAPSIGAIIAAIVFPHIGLLKKQGKILILAILFYAIGTILFGFSKLFVFSLIALFLVGAGDTISTTIRNTIKQSLTPDHLRGRMSAISMIFFLGGPQLGDFEAGAVASVIGAPLSVITGGVGTLIIVGIMTVTIPILRLYENKKTGNS